MQGTHPETLSVRPQQAPGPSSHGCCCPDGRVGEVGGCAEEVSLGTPVGPHPPSRGVLTGRESQAMTLHMPPLSLVVLVDRPCAWWSYGPVSISWGCRSK